MNLSGGQKARVSLARACYSASPLLLLDDPIAAVDVPTAKHLMDHVLAGILKDRTVILVTHNKTSLSYCDRMYLMEHGRLQEIAKDLLLEGELDAVILDPAEGSRNANATDESGSIAMDHDFNKINPVPETVEIVDESSSSADGKGITACKDGNNVGRQGTLTVKEDRSEGEVTWTTYTQYVKDGGG